MDKPVTKKQMEDRFEKQEVMLQKTLDRQTEEIKGYVDETFDRKFDEKFEEKFNQKFEELKDFAETLVENVRAEVGGAYKDEMEVVKDRVTRLERHTGLAGRSQRIV